MNILFSFLYVMGVYSLIKYRNNIKKAVIISRDAIYPKTAAEFSSIILPFEWKEMEPHTKNSRSYRYVQWGTFIALVLLTILLLTVILTDWLESSLFSVAYLFFIIISSIKHRNNLFILDKGIILNGKYYTANEIKNYEFEKIIRWHELYGYHSRVNNAYKVSFKVKTKLLQPSFIVVKDKEHLMRIMLLLDQQGIQGINKTKEPTSLDENFSIKS
jgi:hypothetical protein